MFSLILLSFHLFSPPPPQQLEGGREAGGREEGRATVERNGEDHKHVQDERHSLLNIIQNLKEVDQGIYR